MASQGAETQRRRRNISRQKIVETARGLFREDGYRGTTLDHVAAELGVTRAALYHWVPSKEALLCEIHDEAMDLLLMAFREVDRQDLPPLEKLAGALRNHVLLASSHLDTIAILYQEEASLPEGRARSNADRKRAYDRRLQEIVKDAQEDGTIRPELDPRVVVNCLMGMCNSLYQWYNPSGRIKPERLAEQIVDLAMGGLARR